MCDDNRKSTIYEYIKPLLKIEEDDECDVASEIDEYDDMPNLVPAEQYDMNNSEDVVIHVGQGTQIEPKNSIHAVRKAKQRTYTITDLMKPGTRLNNILTSKASDAELCNAYLLLINDNEFNNVQYTAKQSTYINAIFDKYKITNERTSNDNMDMIIFENYTNIKNDLLVGMSIDKTTGTNNFYLDILSLLSDQIVSGKVSCAKHGPCLIKRRFVSPQDGALSWGTYITGSLKDKCFKCMQLVVLKIIYSVIPHDRLTGSAIMVSKLRLMKYLMGTEFRTMDESCNSSMPMYCVYRMVRALITKTALLLVSSDIADRRYELQDFKQFFTNDGTKSVDVAHLTRYMTALVEHIFRGRFIMKHTEYLGIGGNLSRKLLLIDRRPELSAYGSDVLTFMNDELACLAAFTNDLLLSQGVTNMSLWKYDKMNPMCMRGYIRGKEYRRVNVLRKTNIFTQVDLREQHVKEQVIDYASDLVIVIKFKTDPKLKEQDINYTLNLLLKKLLDRTGYTTWSVPITNEKFLYEYAVNYDGGCFKSHQFNTNLEHLTNDRDFRELKCFHRMLSIRLKPLNEREPISLDIHISGAAIGVKSNTYSLMPF